MAGVSRDAPVADPLELADWLTEHPPAPPEPDPKPSVAALREPPVKPAAKPSGRGTRGSARSKNTQARLTAAARRAQRSTSVAASAPSSDAPPETEITAASAAEAIVAVIAASEEEPRFVPDPGLDALPPLPEPETLPDALPVPGAVSVQAAAWTCSGGHDNAAQAKFCLECGSPRESQRKCPGGHVNPEAAKFCGECGQALVVTSSSTMQALLARSTAPPSELRPRPEHELTDEEKAERERQHAAAVAAGAVIPPLEYELPQGRTYLIHILEDGFTFAGQVWYRGQQLEFNVGSARWEQAQAWINLDDWAQMEQYGKIYFRKGPWPGKKYTDALAETRAIMGPLGGNDEAVKDGPTAQELERAEELERRRRGAVPAPSFR